MYEPLRRTTKRVVLRCFMLSVPVCVNVFKTFFSIIHPVCRATSTTLHTVLRTVPHPLIVTTCMEGTDMEFNIAAAV